MLLISPTEPVGQKKELEEQERFEMIMQDQRGAISLAEKKAKAEGEAEGEVRGEMNKAIAGALNLLRMKVLTSQQIADAMALSVEQVKQLRESIEKD